jgi:hypothetical protein
MIGTVPHGLKNALDEFQWDIFVEKVTHSVDENHARLFPSERFSGQILMQGKIESVSIPVHPHCFEPFGQAFRITIHTASAQLCASGYRIPGDFSPFYFRFRSHGFVLSKC